VIAVDAPVFVDLFRGRGTPGVAALRRLEADGTLLHNHEDYERIATIRPLRTVRGQAPPLTAPSR
jgi:hypothetical protein